MIYLLISIGISSCLFVIFKLFNIYKINTLQAIVVNYLVAFTCGIHTSGLTLNFSEVTSQPWFISALFLGILFVTIFNVMAVTSQRNGLSVASVASKMSVAIPIIFGFVLYSEVIGYVKIRGIILALLAVYLSTTSNINACTVKGKGFVFPFLLFLGSGIIDTVLKYTEAKFVSAATIPAFSITTFLFAFIFGCLFLSVQIFQGRFQFQLKSILGGILLGVPNYYSIVYLLKALQTEGLESAVAFTINNVGIVVLTTIFGLLLFKEKLTTKNWMGMVLAVISILLVGSFF